MLCENCKGVVVNTDKKMWPAVCTVCDADTEVPFKPNPDWPIKCKPCYMETRK